MDDHVPVPSRMLICSYEIVCFVEGSRPKAAIFSCRPRLGTLGHYMLMFIMVWHRPKIIFNRSRYPGVEPQIKMSRASIDVGNPQNKTSLQSVVVWGAKAQQ